MTIINHDVALSTHQLSLEFCNANTWQCMPQCAEGSALQCLHYDVAMEKGLLNEYGCRDAACEKSWKQGNPLSNTIKDTSTIMRNPLSELCREGYA